jgi:V8-like Glu-specific endopeptidase
MVSLEIQDRMTLVDILKSMPALATEQSRRQILQLAGLSQLSPMIDVSGSQFTAVNEIVSYLESYGRLTYDHEALGLFLNVAKSVAGIEQQEAIVAIMNRYAMMTPTARDMRLDEWRGISTETQVYEKIIGENTLRPIAFLTQGLQVARAVAYIGVHGPSGSWSGTGFLVSPDLLLTNHHVLPDSGLLQHSVFRFNYEENFKGQSQAPSEYRAKLNTAIFETDQELDYTFVELESPAGGEWGWLPLGIHTISREERVNIIQHPFGQPKQISMQNNFVDFVGGNVVQYVTSTLNGSSGSPVLNDRWDVVALHHSGGNIREPTTQRRHYRNEGVLIERILDSVSPNLRQSLQIPGPQ